MQKIYFQDKILVNENKVKKKLLQSPNVKTKIITDINVLLNRVRIENKNQIKKRIIFFSFLIAALSLFGFFIVVIK